MSTELNPLGNSFTAFPLEELPPPTIVEQLDFEKQRKQILDRLGGLQPHLFDSYGAPVLLDAELIESDNGEKYFKVPAGDLNALTYLDRESHPFVRWANVLAYMTMNQQQKSQQRSLAILLQFSQDGDLDQLGGLMNVKRLVINPGDPDATPPVPKVMEDNPSFRRRIQLKPESITTAGSDGSYIYHTLSADGDAKDAAVDRPRFERQGNDIVLTYDAALADPNYGDVAVTVLSRTGNGTASEELLSKVDAALNVEKVRPGNDNPRVRSAEIIEYAVVIELTMYDGPDKAVALAEALKRVDEYVEKVHGLGKWVRRSKLDAAAGIAGVENVNIISPAADVQVNQRQAAFCTSASVTEATSV